MTTTTPPRRTARSDRPWWKALLDTAPALLDLPGTLGDLVGELSAAVLEDPEDFLPGKRRGRTRGRDRTGGLDVLGDLTSSPTAE
jgi:hypothetical protein